MSIFFSFPTFRLPWAFLGGLLALSFASLGCPKTALQTPPPPRSDRPPSDDPHPPLLGSDLRRSFQGMPRFSPSRGPLFAPLEVVEFFNPLAPSAASLPALRQTLWERYPGLIRWFVVFSPPLTRDRGYFLSRSLAASHGLGAFWPYLRRLSRQPRPPDDPTLYALAQTIGVDRSRFDLLLRSPLSSNLVNSMMLFAHRHGLLGTSRLFLNGLSLPSPISESALLPIFDAEAKRIRALQDRNLTREEIRQILHKAAKPPPPPASTPAPLLPTRSTFFDLALTEAIPFRGPADAPIQIIEFSDFTCLPCRTAWLHLRRLQNEFPLLTRLYFKILPIQIHPQGQRAAEIAIAAHLRRKFWTMADLLFQEQPRLLRGEILDLLKEGGLDPNLLSGELDRGTYQRRILLNQTHARMYRIQAVPAIFINGRRLEDPSSYDALKALVLDELWRSGQPRSSSP